MYGYHHKTWQQILKMWELMDSLEILQIIQNRTTIGPSFFIPEHISRELHIQSKYHICSSFCYTKEIGPTYFHLSKEKSVMKI